MDLRQKSALVLGGSGGIGKEICAHLIKRGIKASFQSRENNLGTIHNVLVFLTIETGSNRYVRRVKSE